MPLLISILVFLFPNQEKNSAAKPEGFVRIPAGKYVLGSKGHWRNPTHTVQLQEFYLSATEITNKQFSDFVNATGYTTIAERYKNAMTFYVGLDEFEWITDSTANWRFPFGEKQGGIEEKMNHPVTCISYMDALAYCEWAKVRLPTLDEWEAACRAHTTTRYYWGNKPERIQEYANIWKSRDHKTVNVPEDYLWTAPVASYKPNPWGLYDMYGNVFEFCEGAPLHTSSTKDMVSSRGGSWWCSKNSCNFFNSVDIGRINKYASFSNNGFRVVLLKKVSTQ